MWSLFIPAGAAEREHLLLALWEHGTAGIIEEPHGLRAFFEKPPNQELSALIGQLHGASTSTDSAPASSFERENWDPILVGERFFIVPPWVRDPPPAGRLRLEVDAATAFGTGRHETTQLCIEALERYLQPDSAIVDVGCGSGILSAAARLLGARRIVSCDIHDDALATTRQHVTTPVFRGSADALASASADLVLANISAAVLDRLAFDLRRITKPDGLLIVSGFIIGNPPESYQAEEVLQRGDWLCWICRASGVTPVGRSTSGGLHERAWWL